MFIGHYGVALALRRAEKNASLGWLFFAAQLVDILLFALVLLGVERLRIVENFTQSTHFELEFIPYTHGLVGSLVWAAAAYVVSALLPAKQGMNKKRVALVVGAAVFSHWILDLIVHTPDLPLLGDSSPKLGLGLWNSAPLTFTVEVLLLLTGVFLYLRGTKARTVTGKYGMIAFAFVLVAANALNTFGAPPGSAGFLVISALASYLAFGGIAFWLDGKRT